MTDSATHPLTAPYRKAWASFRRLLAAAPLSVGATLATVLLVPTAAHAISGQAAIVMNKWKSMDKCAIEAQRLFPEFTAEANAKRDAKLKECLAIQNLPPRETASPAH
ncbi:MAG: hypothetical protein AB7H71_05620 [Alphaproteobacteria bacterium]